MGCLNILKDVHDRFKTGIGTLLFSGLRLPKFIQNICFVARDSNFMPCWSVKSSSLSCISLTIYLRTFSIWEIQESRWLFAVTVEALWVSSFWWHKSIAAAVFLDMASSLASSFDLRVVKKDVTVVFEVGFTICS